MANANTKGQIIGQVFVFILAGLVFVLIISYGYSAIKYFLEQQEQTVLIDFKTDVETSVEQVKRDYGSVRKVQLKLPSEYAGVCFLDGTTCSTQTPKLLLPGRTLDAPWMQDACSVKSANVFTIPRTIDLLLADIEISSPGFVCIPNNNGIIIRMEGTGKRTKISPWIP